MPSVEFEGQTFNVDEDGFIDDFNNWSEENKPKGLRSLPKSIGR
jgi:sulfur relay (sulfurtransferase) DsrC/TusE family protein